MGLFLYPLPDEYVNAFDNTSFQDAKTYSTHGVGKLDFACPKGTVVRSMTNGEVVRAGCDTDGSYQSIQIKVTDPSYKMPSGQNYFIIRYYHIGNMRVNEGDFVKQGDVIATTGEDLSTERVSDHLHLDFALSIMPTLWGRTLENEQLNSDQKEAYQIWIPQSAGNDYRGRCWEVIGTRAKRIDGNSDSGVGQPQNTSFVKTLNRGTYYGNYPTGASTKGGSGRVLLGCDTVSDYKGLKIKGSVACRLLVLGENDNGTGCGYNYNGDRTICYVEVPEYDELNGYYFLDDSNGVGDTDPYSMIDFYYVSYNDVPSWFKNVGVIKTGIKLYMVNLS